jgi:transmembrane sensor
LYIASSTDMINLYVPLIAGFSFRNRPGTTIAAVVILALGAGLYFRMQNPIRQGRNRAILISADGRPRILDDSKLTFAEGNAAISRIKRNGGMLYIVPNDPHAAKDEYITVYTPRGGQFSLLFPDSTSVSLNAQSRIRYPANFSQYSIELQVEGEVYVKVARNPNPRLRIAVGSVQIQPFGARMDIMSYPDEPPTITMIKDSAKVWLDQKYPGMDGTGITLHPAEQAILGDVSMGELAKLIVVPVHGDTKNIIDWKNGNTTFRDASIQTIMHAVSRWYDVDISFNSDISDKKYNISVPRSAGIYDLLSILEQQGARFDVQGKTITVIK